MQNIFFQNGKTVRTLEYCADNTWNVVETFKSKIAFLERNISITLAYSFVKKLDGWKIML